jgi:hypothetical protein
MTFSRRAGAGPPDQGRIGCDPGAIPDLDAFNRDSGMINHSFNEKTHVLAGADRSATRDRHFSGIGPRLELFRI